MKTLLRSVILVCAMAVTSFATAASFTVKETKNNIYRVQYFSEQKATVTISILNSQNEVVFEEEISSNGSFIRPYNFSSQPEGDYTIILKDKNGEQREVISYATDKSISYAHVSEVPNQENKYWLNIVNNAKENMTVRIYSLKGDLLHEQSITVDGAYSKIFNVSQLNQPAVVFEVTTNNGMLYSSLFN